MSYDELVLARKSCRACVELTNPADPTHAHYDGPEVGPWSRWLASRPAKLILVGQDWGTDGYFRDHRGRDVAENRTDQHLIEFLSLLGFEVGPPNETDRQSGVFATNAVLCLKRGEANALSAPVKQGWFSACRTFLKWTIEESSAPSVIALGRHAYESVARAYGTVPRPFREAVETSSPIRLDAPRRLFAVFHPAARPKDRTISQMRADWTRVAAYLL
jgi:uracil DNA glycosylase superfamily protein